jgi:microcystin-dependent protein
MFCSATPALKNCLGNNNTAIGHNSQKSNTSFNCNTTLGSETDVLYGSNNIAIGYRTQSTFCNNSIVIGNNITCNTDNQILLGDSSQTVYIPGNLTFSQNLNNISASTFGYLSGLTSNIQDYMNNKNNFFSIISQSIGNQNSAFGLNSFSSNTSGGYNAAFGYNSLKSNTGGAYSTAIGCNSLQYNNAFGNTAIGYNSGINIINGIYNTFIGHNTQATYDVSNSTAIGNNAICDASNQIMLGTTSETVVIPGNLRIYQSINNIPFEIFGFLSGLSGNVQNQINNSNSNISTLQTKTVDMFWTPGQINKTTITNQCETTTLSFSNTLNNISTTTFSYLSGLTSNIQQQINALSNVNPPGMVIAFAGTSTTLTGYLLCDGSIYNSSYYPYLFNAIGYTYGGDTNNGNFRVPNYKGLFLRSTGSQSVQGKTYTSPVLGTTLNDKSTQFTTSEFVDHIHTEVRSFVTGSSDFMAPYQYSNAVSSLNFTKSSNTFNSGNLETHPVHTSVQYFIKY